MIRRYFAGRRAVTPGVRLGIGDDAAIMRVPPGRDLVVSTDTIVEGTHFERGAPPRALGHRCLAVNLSDLAAMGAQPLWATLVISIPRADSDWIGEFARGFFALARRAPISLVGGDTVRGPLALTVTVHGSVARGAYITRAGARPGDSIYVTGSPGDALAGRLLVQRRSTRPTRRRLQPADRNYLVRRFHYPTPRLAEGAALASFASAMIDVSDGLDEDLGKLLAASRVGGWLEVGAIPLSGAATRIAGVREARVRALTGGDDYELLFSVPRRREARLLRVAAGWRCRVTRLGTVTSTRSRIWRDGEREFAVPSTSFRHF